jgi:phospholipid transport system substrate-binding protein
MFRLLLIAALISFCLGFSSAHAASGDDARQFVDSVGQKVLAIVNGSGTESDKQQQLRQMFSDSVDMDWMGRFALGHTWSQSSEDQHNRYLEAYRNYLLARYTTNFADYAGSKYTITGVKPAEDNQFIVAMDVKSPHASEQETQAGYRVRPSANGQFKITDIIIEGVSLITTERSEFAAVVQKDGMDKLIEQLKAKTEAKTS